MPNRVGRFMIDSDEDMCHVFDQYSETGVKNIEMFVEFLLIDTISCRVVLPPINIKF